MPDRRKRFTGEFKSKPALEAIKGQRTLAEIAGEYGVHPDQITQWIWCYPGRTEKQPTG